MNGRRRGLVLGGLALVLGGLAASDVAGREAALERRIGPSGAVVVARTALEPGTRITARHLGLRRVPARFAPAGAFTSPRDLVGLTVGSAVGAGSDMTAAVLDDGDRGAVGAPVRRGERVADVIATASPEAIQPGGRVDLLVTRERGDGAGGRTTLALQDVEVLASSGVPEGPGRDPAPRVQASLRVTLRQAVYLAAAQAFASELRLLPRAAGDRRRADALEVTDGL